MQKLEPIMDLGFSAKEAYLIEDKLKTHKINISALSSRYGNTYNNLKACGYNDMQIKKIIVIEPRLIYCADVIKERYKNIKKKVLSNKPSDLGIVARSLIFTEKTLNDKYDNLINLGFNKKQICLMLSKDPKFITRSATEIKDCFNFFVDKGIDKKE